MSKQQYALKLIPPRPTFALDITTEEQAIMQDHMTYQAGLMKAGIVRMFGLVMDPAGPYGFGVVEVDNEAQVGVIIANDPASSISRYEYYETHAVFQDSSEQAG
jgi:hypothetical protein